MKGTGIYLYHRAKFWYCTNGLEGLGNRLLHFLCDFVSPRRRASGVVVQYLFSISDRKKLREDASRFFEYSSNSKITIEEPDYHVDSLPPRLLHNKGTYLRDQPATFEISDVLLIESLGVPVYAGNKIVLETFGGRRHKLERYLSETPPTTLNMTKYRIFSDGTNYRTIDNGVSLLNIKYGYFDWVQVALTMLYGISVYKEQTGKRPTLLIRPNPPNWAVEYLNLMGFTEDDWVEWGGQRLKVNTLIVPTSGAGEFAPGSIPSPIYRDDHLKILNANVARSIRDMLVGKISETQIRSENGRVYISRQNGSRGRKILNFSELRDVLDQFGFDIYQFEDLTISDQISIMSDADVVVAPHGAGLVNMLFSKNSKVIELLGPEKRKATFYLFSKSLGHEYGYLLCNRTMGGLKVNVKELSIMFDEMGLDKIK